MMSCRSALWVDEVSPARVKSQDGMQMCSRQQRRRRFMAEQTEKEQDVFVVAQRPGGPLMFAQHLDAPWKHDD